MKDHSPSTRVLVLEDEWLIAEQIEMELTDAGFDVVGPVGSVREALDLLEKETVDVAVLDISLHNERSIPVAERLVQMSTPFVFMSGYVAADLPPGLKETPLLAKPIKPGALPDRLMHLLALT